MRISNKSGRIFSTKIGTIKPNSIMQTSDDSAETLAEANRLINLYSDELSNLDGQAEVIIDSQIVVPTPVVAKAKPVAAPIQDTSDAK